MTEHQTEQAQPTEVKPVNGGSPTESRTPAPAKRESAATRKAKATQGKPVNGKPAGSKQTPKAEPAGLAPNARKQVVGDAVIDAVAEMIKNWNHAEITVEEAMALAGSYCSFTPGSYWRPELSEPDTGRGHKHRLDSKGREAQRKFIASKRTPKRTRKAA